MMVEIKSKLRLLMLVLAFTSALCVRGNSNPELPRLSPRPTTVEGVSSCNVSLNGDWKFQTSSIKPTNIEVPGEWTMQGFDVPEGETAIYTRSFTIPADWQNQRIKIRFDGVSSYGLVKVNGQTVGEHEGGMVPFELDITKAVKPGANELRVEVKALTVSDRLGCISQYAVHTVGGLVRKVALYALPAVNVASMNVYTELDKTGKTAHLKLTTGIANESSVQGKVNVEYVLTDADGKKIASTQSVVDNTHQVNTQLVVKNARLWNAEQPYLYVLTTTLFIDGKPAQINKQRVGLRQVEVKGSQLLVNGKKVKLHGVNRHEVHPLRGRSLTPELCRKDAEIFRAGNCNYIRTSHYPPSEEFLDACDELGLFVESEAAITWIQHHASPIWKNWNYEDEQYLPHMVRANLDNIAGNRHHPSIIIWSLGNESRWSKLWEQVLATAKAADPTRPTSLHDQCWGGFNNAGSKADIANYHYPGVNGPAACDTMSRPTLFGEYAHLSCYSRPELATDPGVRAAFGKPLVQMYDSMYYHDACLGGALWSGIDDIFHLADGRIVGYGPWGPIDGWRREKPEYIGMKKAYSPFRLLNYNWSYDDKKGTQVIVLNVENRYDYNNLNQVKIEYGSKNGTMTEVKTNILPRSNGKIVLQLKEKEINELYLRVTDPRGFVCEEEMLVSSVNKTTAPPASEKVAIQVEETPEAIRIQTGAQVYTIAKVTGLITQATSGGKVLLRQGPVLSLVQMNFNDGGKPNVAGETYQNNVYPDKHYPLYTLFAKTCTYRKEGDGSVVVDVESAYNGGSTGKISYRFTPEKRVEVSYRIVVASEREIQVRQYGLLMQVPQSLQTLQWEREGEFSVYPEYDIARTKGTAELNANQLYEVEAWRATPQGTWKEDANILGSVDFRSTKTQIKNASLTDKSGNGLLIHSNGKQALRAWKQDGSIQILVADYSNAGSEPFYGSPFTNGRLKVKKDDVLEGKMIFELK